ncbi:TerB family tellurite resistance protein [candidate division KSB1 bacterium]|nr:TerB family tellurite resistance protein [candidate division KSB1 bacterium]TDJ01748.1 MAG: TerB family tellurite resistance protein [Caldithrix sp.]
MLDFINKVFGAVNQSDSTDSKRVQNHDIRIATCALFLEMAQIDGEFSEKERQSILGILKQEYDLSDEVAVELTEAADKERQDSIDLWQFTNQINENYSEDEKIRVVEFLWKLVYADGKLDQHEDYLIHKLATLLGVRHDQLIDAKVKILNS